MEVEQEPAVAPSDAQEVKEEQPEEAPDADKIKEQGNAAFKAGRFSDAVDLYSRAIGMY